MANRHILIYLLLSVSFLGCKKAGLGLSEFPASESEVIAVLNGVTNEAELGDIIKGNNLKGEACNAEFRRVLTIFSQEVTAQDPNAARNALNNINQLKTSGKISSELAKAAENMVRRVFGKVTGGSDAERTLQVIYSMKDLNTELAKKDSPLRKGGMVSVVKDIQNVVNNNKAYPTALKKEEKIDEILELAQKNEKISAQERTALKNMFRFILLMLGRGGEVEVDNSLFVLNQAILKFTAHWTGKITGKDEETKKLVANALAKPEKDIVLSKDLYDEFKNAVNSKESVSRSTGKNSSWKRCKDRLNNLEDALALLSMTVTTKQQVEDKSIIITDRPAKRNITARDIRIYNGYSHSFSGSSEDNYPSIHVRIATVNNQQEEIKNGKEIIAGFWERSNQKVDNVYEIKHAGISYTITLKELRYKSGWITNDHSEQTKQKSFVVYRDNSQGKPSAIEEHELVEVENKNEKYEEIKNELQKIKFTAVWKGDKVQFALGTLPVDSTDNVKTGVLLISDGASNKTQSGMAKSLLRFWEKDNEEKSLSHQVKNEIFNRLKTANPFDDSSQKTSFVLYKNRNQTRANKHDQFSFEAVKETESNSILWTKKTPQASVKSYFMKIDKGVTYDPYIFFKWKNSSNRPVIYIKKLGQEEYATYEKQ